MTQCDLHERDSSSFCRGHKSACFAMAADSPMSWDVPTQLEPVEPDAAATQMDSPSPTSPMLQSPTVPGSPAIGSDAQTPPRINRKRGPSQMTSPMTSQGMETPPRPSPNKKGRSRRVSHFTS